ncbi:hypothetical protein FJZ33_07845, partial [Candidatus Poribacteria bacterium]|nr:hypothetical protein [Candidatus Poribacteria bacterium]
MNKILKLAKREYKASVKSKGFIIGLILSPIFMCGGLIAFWIFKDRVDVTDKKVAIIDRSGVIAQSIVRASEYRNSKDVYDQKTGKKIKPAYLMEIVTPNDQDIQAQRLEFSNRIRKGEIHAFLEIGPGIVHPGKDPNAASISYYAKNAAIDDIRGWLIWPINNQLRQLRLAEAGIDEASV